MLLCCDPNPPYKGVSGKGKILGIIVREITIVYVMEPLLGHLGISSPLQEGYQIIWNTESIITPA
jgi:hypothetical protein